MKKDIWIAVVVIIAVVGAWAWQNYEAGLPHKIVIASGHPEWPPIMFQQGSAIVGVGPDLVTKVFGDLGVQVDSKYEGAWDVVQTKAQSGAVDVLVAAYKTDARQAYMDYSIPYTTDPIVLFVKKGSAFPFKVWSDLIGKKGLATVGDSYGQQFDDYITQSLTVARVPDTQTAFADLENGTADYFLDSLYAGTQEAKDQGVLGELETLPVQVTAEQFYITISKKSPFDALLPQVNARIQYYLSSGYIGGLVAKYQGQSANATSTISTSTVPTTN